MNVDKKNIWWARNIGHLLIMDYIIEIGGTCIDKEYGEWLGIWLSLRNEETKKINENEEIVIEI